ncbi:MAG: hypothetical protein WAW37_03775 [Syntrophobacteraceae bacterium]
MSTPDTSVREVVVVDVKMRFWSMVFFMVKWAVASIPALIILAVLMSILAALFHGFSWRWDPGKFRM